MFFNNMRVAASFGLKEEEEYDQFNPTAFNVVPPTIDPSDEVNNDNNEVPDSDDERIGSLRGRAH